MPESPVQRGRPETVYDPDSKPPLELEMREVAREEHHFLARVYGLLASGLALSTLVAFWALRHPEMFEYVQEHRGGFQVLFLFEVITVAVLSRFAAKMSTGIAWLTFVGYSLLNGISFCVFFQFLPPGSVAFGFLMATLTYVVMSAWGMYSPDGALLGIRGMLKTALVGFSLTAAANLFAGNETEYWETACLAIGIFAGLTCYHTDEIRDLPYEFEDDDRAHSKAAILGALLIYLDFVNLYLLIMQAFSIFASKMEQEKEEERRKW